MSSGSDKKKGYIDNSYLRKIERDNNLGFSRPEKVTIMTRNMNKDEIQELFPMFETLVQDFKSAYEYKIEREIKAGYNEKVNRIKSDLYDLLDEVDESTQQKIEKIIQDT